MLKSWTTRDELFSGLPKAQVTTYSAFESIVPTIIILPLALKNKEASEGRKTQSRSPRRPRLCSLLRAGSFLRILPR
jgi:hypothetical protein